MRRLAFLVLTISLLLCACGTQGEDVMQNFVTQIAQAEEIHLRAQICADVGDEVFNFTVDYSKNAETERVEIIEPEILSGVAAEITDGGAALHYDSLVLALGSMGDGINPMNVLSLALGGMAQGSFSEVRTEKDGENEFAAAEFFVSDTCTATAYLDRSGKLCHITVYENSAAVAECEILNFSTDKE